MFEDGMMQGYVRYIWPSGHCYQGFMRQNIKEGYGTYYAPNGSIIYTGEWKNNHEARCCIIF